jgi:hypothetical protein
MSENQGGGYGQGDIVPNDPYAQTASYSQPPQPPVQPGYGPGYAQQQPQPPMPGYYGPPQGVPQKTNGLAVAGMVLGIISLVFFWAGFFGMIIAVVAIILSSVGISQTNRNGQAGKGMAIAGLTTSLVAVGLFVIVVAFVASVANSL